MAKGRRGTVWPIACAAIVPGVVLVRPAEIPLATLRAKYASPASQFLRLGHGVLIHVRDEGARDRPVRLLLPGRHSPLQVWEPWVAPMHGDLRLVSIDLPGHRATLGKRLGSSSRTNRSSGSTA